MFLEGSGGLRLGSKTPDLLVGLPWNWWHVEVEHAPFGLPNCAGLMGGRLFSPCDAGRDFSWSTIMKPKRRGRTLLLEALEKYGGAPAPGDLGSRAEVLGKSRQETRWWWWMR